MDKSKDAKPAIKGWYSVRFKSNLSLSESEKRGLVRTLIDWVFFDGKNWDALDYTKEGFYVADIIKLDKESVK